MATTAKKAAAKKTAETESKPTLNQAYGAASQRLRAAHREEFNGYYKQEAEQRGLKWEPRLTPEEKAKATLDALLAEHPHLLDDRVTQVEAPPGAPTS